MAKRGRLVTFHGAFGTKARAVAKERRVGKGAFVKKIQYRKRRKDRKKGKLQTRWAVLTRNP